MSAILLLAAVRHLHAEVHQSCMLCFQLIRVRVGSRLLSRVTLRVSVRIRVICGCGQDGVPWSE